VWVIHIYLLMLSLREVKEYGLFSPPNDREKVITNLLCVFIALTIAVALKCIQVYLSKISRYAVIAG